MNDVASWLLMLTLVAIGVYIAKSLSALELARAACREACVRANVQLLDDTVASTRIRFKRNEAGHRVFQRTYRFEFTETGNTRLEGQLIMLGHTIETITLEPYQCEGQILEALPPDTHHENRH